MAPKLTIILTSRDKYELLRFAVASVMEQTYQDWELIVVDDASEDPRVTEYLSELEGRDARVRVFRGQPVTESYRKLHKMNALRINAAIHMSKGEYISYLGDDNVYLPDRCTRLAHVLDNDDNNVDMVVDQVRWVMFDGREADQDDYKYNYIEPFEPGHDDVLAAIAPSTYICTDSVMHRKPKRRCCMEWPTDVQSHTPVDWWYWCYLVTEHKYKIRRLNYVGERAYFPGTWRGGVVVKDVLSSRRDMPPGNRRDDMGGIVRRKKQRRKEQKMSKRKKATDQLGKVWCVNTSGSVQQITQDSGAPLVVERDGRIEESKVATHDSEGKRTGIFPGFSYDSRVETPSIKDVMAERPAAPKIDYETDAQGIDASLAVKPEAELAHAIITQPQGQVPPPDKRKRAVATRRPVEKRPTDTPPSEADTKSRRCTECGKPIYAGNKSGMCRACYNASRTRKE